MLGIFWSWWLTEECGCFLILSSHGGDLALHREAGGVCAGEHTQPRALLRLVKMVWRFYEKLDCQKDWEKVVTSTWWGFGFGNVLKALGGALINSKISIIKIAFKPVWSWFSKSFEIRIWRWVLRVLPSYVSWLGLSGVLLMRLGVQIWWQVLSALMWTPFSKKIQLLKSTDRKKRHKKRHFYHGSHQNRSHRHPRFGWNLATHPLCSGLQSRNCLQMRRGNKSQAWLKRLKH